MREESEIQEQADKAVDATQKPSQYSGMTYEQGVRDALDWVLEATDDPPMV